MDLVPCDADAGGVDEASGGVDDFWSDAVAGDEGDVVGFHLGVIGECYWGVLLGRRCGLEMSGVLDDPLLEGGGREVEEVACEDAGEPWDAVGGGEGAGDGGGEGEPCGAALVVDEGAGAAGPLSAFGLVAEGAEDIVSGARGEPEDFAGGGGCGGGGERGGGVDHGEFSGREVVAGEGDDVLPAA